MKLKLKVPATTANLGPGFDCLGAALSLYNEFEIKVLKERSLKNKIQIFAKGVDTELISTDATNYVYKAIRKIFELTRNEILPMEIHIKNNIPLQRGLGSSATAYVAGVVAGNILCGEPLSEYELVNIAAELEGHPDNVVPCMFGGLCVTTLIDGKIKFVKLPVPKDLVVLVIIPDKKISTEDARKILPQEVNFKDAVKNVGNVALLLSSFITKKYEFLKFATQDFLHQPYRKKLMPWMDQIFDICLANKALCCMLSGSGSSIIAIYKTKDLSASLLERIQQEVKNFVDCELKQLHFSSRGVIIH